MLAAVEKMLRMRAETMAEAWSKNSGDVLNQRRHLDEGTPERAYWHAGYIAVMRAALDMIEGGVSEWPTELPGVGRVDY